MAFRFNWPEFDAGFYDEAKSQLEAALNKGNKPKNIVDHITVKELHMGSTPPELEILEVGELSTDKFRGIFKLTYAGDAYIVLQTKVQANPMHAKQSSHLARHTRPKILAADRPLVVPMLLRISDLRLRGIIVLVVSKTKGITLVFKNDPLESIVISSTFDSVTSVRNFLQREIEKQLRNLFQEDLPVMIHNLSLRHIQNEREKEELAKRRQRPAPLRASFSDIMPMYRPTPPAIYTEYASIQAMHQYLQNCVDDSVSVDSSNSPIMSPTASTVCGSVVSSSTVADIYAEDGDAPWYVVEGPEIPSLSGSAEQQIPVMFDQEIILRPTENALAARLAQLTCASRTFSPLPPVIQHSVCRSFPHIVKTKPMNRRGRKVPKRRIIHLSLRGNNDNNQ
ncbi:hypothetical protein BDB00DRAFT_761595 [Zychaea mexicana]|uniref:uncharacterized protein n=1 Tax=Zychaea mexicana TaxID=64656 RepID=UPI0022FE9DD6|nr:uncharacterized protein BDB00DRAFT_761595 [Zychaea mexicana]KAI9494626.1 hypothetical protein BDB00DRAFT_761595 [Zychaea mexicana]